MAFVKRAVAGFDSPVVIDVGCGYGRTLIALREEGIRAVGVDVNAEALGRNRSNGFTCYTPAEFAGQEILADVMVMSVARRIVTPLMRAIWPAKILGTCTRADSAERAATTTTSS